MKKKTENFIRRSIHKALGDTSLPPDLVQKAADDAIALFKNVPDPKKKRK